MHGHVDVRTLASEAHHLEVVEDVAQITKEWVATLPLFDDAKEAEAYAATIREQKEREGRKAFDTVPHGYGQVLVCPRVRGLSPGDWLRRYFRREFGRGIASRWFN